MSGALKKRSMPRIDDKLIEKVREMKRRMDQRVHDLIIVPTLAKQVKARRSKGGKKSAEGRTKQRDDRIDKLRSERAKLDSDMKQEAIAAILAERGFGGKSAIEKLLRAKKSSEGR